MELCIGHNNINVNKFLLACKALFVASIPVEVISHMMLSLLTIIDHCVFDGHLEIS